MLNIVSVAVMICLPLLIYFGYKEGIEPRFIAFALLLFYGIRSGIFKKKSLRSILKSKQLYVVGSIILFFGIVIALNRATFFLYIPAFVNLGLLLSFGSTLFLGPPIIETFARRQVKKISAEEIHYCRNLTVLWSLFFLLNGTVSVIIALKDNMEYWVIYNGFISYILIGLFFAVEMTYRYWRFRNYGTTIIDSFYKRIFKEKHK